MKRAWKIYLLTLLVYLALIGGFFASAWIALYVQLARGVVAREDLAVDFQGTMVRAVSGATGILISVIVTGALLAGIGLALGLREREPGGAPREVLVRRMRFLPVRPLEVVLATVGVLGVSMALDSLVALLGLSEVGTLPELRESLGGLRGAKQLGAAVILGLGPGFGEEIYFRGFMMRRLEALAGWRHALIGSSIGFGLFHWDWVHAPVAAVLGVFLGYAVLRTGSIWTGIIAHAVNNGVATYLSDVDLTPSANLLLGGCGLVAAISALQLLRTGPRPLVTGPW